MIGNRRITATEDLLLERNATLAVRLRYVQQQLHERAHGRAVPWAKCGDAECRKTQGVILGAEQHTHAEVRQP